MNKYYIILIGFKLVGDQVLVCEGMFWNGTRPECVIPYNPATSCDFEAQHMRHWYKIVHDEPSRRIVLKMEEWPEEAVCGFSRRSNLENGTEISGKSLNWIWWNK